MPKDNYLFTTIALHLNSILYLPKQFNCCKIKPMKKIVLILICLQLLSCHKKKLTELVEVPLPTKEEKIEIGDPDDIKATDGAFQITKLNFKYSALEPNIDALTMETHYSKHYLNYTNNLNEQLIGTEFANSAIEEILKKLDLNRSEERRVGKEC